MLAGPLTTNQGQPGDRLGKALVIASTAQHAPQRCDLGHAPYVPGKTLRRDVLSVQHSQARPSNSTFCHSSQPVEL